MRSRGIQFTVVAAICFAAGPAIASPSIGDKAPPLTISEWVQGKPVDLDRDKGKKIYMVEFWATWCPPCKASVPRLSKFQKKYEKELTIIGVTATDNRGNTAPAIRRFVKKQGDNMIYHVAIDEEQKTWDRYMGAFAGIPHAFLVGRSGHIVWQGSPLDETLDQVLDDVISGDYDVDSAKVAAEVDRRFEELGMLARMQRWSALWDGLVSIMILDPTNDLAMMSMRDMYNDGYQDEETFRKWATKHIEKNREDMRAMQRLAACLCDFEDMSKSMPDLALEAARAAYNAPGGKEDAESLATYALAVYRIGEIDRAIAVQQKALNVSDDATRDARQAMLDYYLLCKKLQAKAY